jgi:hypothetical protein
MPDTSHGTAQCENERAKQIERQDQRFHRLSGRATRAVGRPVDLRAPRRWTVLRRKQSNAEQRKRNDRQDLVGIQQDVRWHEQQN